MKHCIVATLFALIFIFSATTTHAHPGRTAADGCHYCRTNCDSWGVAWDERHCHNTVPFSEPEPIAPTTDPTPYPTDLPTMFPTSKPIKKKVAAKKKIVNKCGAKKYCTQMKSCQEATYYFRSCGLTKLDGDKDGTPCER